MRKLALFAALLLLPIMAGCSVEVTVDNPRPEVYAFISSETSTGQVGEIISGLEKAADDFRLSIETIQMDLSYHPDDAFKKINKAIRKSTKALIVSSFENDELAKYLEKAHKKGIPIIYMDPVKKFDISGTYITYNKKEAAVKAGQLLAEAMEKEGEAVLLNTSWDDPKAADLENGFKEALQQYPAIKLINLYCCNGQRDNTRKTLQDILAAHPNIKGILAACPETAAAAAEYVNNERKGEIQIVAFDYTDEIVQLINHGQLCGTVGLNYSDLGYEAVRTAADVISGHNVDSDIVLDFETLVRKDPA